MSDDLVDPLNIVSQLNWELDPRSKFHFNVLRSHLEWEDETAFGTNISEETAELIADLFVSRNIFVHLPQCGLSFADLGIADPDHFQLIWNRAVEFKIRWPGMYRVELSDPQIRLLQQSISADVEGLV